MKHAYAVIMAGGGGTRLWPISRKKHPKHLLKLLGERTLFQGTVDRLKDFIPLDRILVVTTKEQEQELKKQEPQLPTGNFIIEPMPRGTASVVALAAAVLAKRDPEAVMIVLPADHYIQNNDQFNRHIQVAVKVATLNYLVTLGITPTFPATGYGYIERDEVLPEKFEPPVFRVLRFIEKPDEPTACKFIESGNYSWNSGIFIWRVDRILKEFQNQMPDLKSVIDKIGATWGTSDQDETLSSGWTNLKTETIDYGIMEHAANVAVLPADGLEWSDIGSWDSLFDLLVPDKDGNVVVKSDYMPLETKNTLVYSSEMKLVVTIGLEDLIIIDSSDALLVCRRDQAQKVRQVIENLKKSQRDKYR